MSRPTVLFLCVQNAGRSQMAAGLLRHLGEWRVNVLSGGTDPTYALHEEVVAAMADRGIDLTGEAPTPWTDETLDAADVIVTMGCGEECPVVPGTRYVDWDLEDPADRDPDGVRRIRDDIEKRVRTLMDELGIEPVR